MGDGVANCQDASDETQGDDVVACADGTASRRNPEYAGQKFELCKMPNPCLPQFGQVCLNIHGRFRCICQLGMIRPPGPSIRCIPIEALPNALAQGATTNCSDLIDDLKKLYKYLGNGLKIESIRRSNEKVKDDPTDANITYQLDDQSLKICPIGQKNVDNRCIGEQIFIASFISFLELINECENSTLNDCDKNASCMDNDLSYECLCKEGYIDTSDSPKIRPGIKCRKRELLFCFFC